MRLEDVPSSVISRGQLLSAKSSNWRIAISRSPVPENAFDVPLKLNNKDYSPPYPQELSSRITAAQWEADIVNGFWASSKREVVKFRKRYLLRVVLGGLIAGPGVGLAITGGNVLMLYVGLGLMALGALWALFKLAINKISSAVDKEVPGILRDGEHLDELHAKPHYESQDISFEVVEEVGTELYCRRASLAAGAAVPVLQTREARMAFLRIVFPSPVHPPMVHQTHGTVPNTDSLIATPVGCFRVPYNVSSNFSLDGKTGTILVSPQDGMSCVNDPSVPVPTGSPVQVQALKPGAITAGALVPNPVFMVTSPIAAQPTATRPSSP